MDVAAGLQEVADNKEEFGDLAITMFGDGVKSGHSSPLEDALLGDPDNCRLCSGPLNVPRLLSCLHVFCEHCLDKKLIDEGGDAGTLKTSLICPLCEQETKVGTKKLASLPLDVMTTNISDVTNSLELQCTSCTAKEMAVSRCSTCHNLLCGNCEKAHRFMRLFEKHVVISLEDMRKEGKKITIHKPLICPQHAGEHVIYYCSTCKVPVCAECAKVEHQGHQYDAILDSEMRVRQELERMLEDTKAKRDVMMKASSEIDSSLEELANQRSSSRDLINESYQSYKAVLEKCRDKALVDLNNLYRERELKVMDMTQKVGKEIDLLEDACKYAARVLEIGTVAEIMYLRNVVGTQLQNLIKNTAKPECKYSLEFLADYNEFKSTLKKVFGHFRTENGDTCKQAKENGNLPVSLAPLAINGPPALSNGSLSNSSPISLPTSMQSSFDGGDLISNLQGLNLAAQSPPVSQINQGLQGFSSIAEYNLAQLASLAETNESTTTSSNTQPLFTDLFTDTAYKNLQSLAKLGNFNNTDNGIANGGNMLVRPNSPVALTISNNLLNGFGGVSSSTSPLLSTPDDMLPDPLSSLVQATTANVPTTVTRAAKVSPMQIRCKFGQLGPGKGQFNSPHGFCLGLEEDIVVADTNNHRIQIFEKSGTFKFQFGMAGKDEGQLWYPRKVAVMRSSGKYVVCDRGNERSRMQIFTKNGHFLKKIAIRYIDIVAGLAVTSVGEIVAVDSVSPTVFVISETGDLIRWFDCSDYMREPSDIAIHGKEFYVCDFKGHNVVVFSEEGSYIRRIGQENITSYPNGIDISDAGDILIGDSHGNRFHVAVFGRDGVLISEFECPYVKVSRCCGLKITSEGYVVTLAKNNHHVLVLNTLYIL
ncbi:PREDICTED: brain tumor protein [Nicrophorus vespilloides]|uniref:Brain tumor protein n=1 Tax=Nicrophorus vespilloides TaxID=110193 RepID=A0ABM1NH87_NICVS|nr:PREDICTED: brain tumor protein [Nicrophorus vespilloides]XP_017786188.1 PREDICTED: brain tumor protein [Nicrophorus vespilloides]XP_017786189.1 PREDICTED: brain tumor protein [Nicrophorus vespilloides]